MPTFGQFTVREVTVGRVERFLKTQREKSYSRAKHARTILGMVMSFAVRREIVARNPVMETSRLKKPKHVPKALTAEQIAQIRAAARSWRTAEGRHGPRPNGQIRDLSVNEALVADMSLLSESGKPWLQRFYKAFYWFLGVIFVIFLLAFGSTMAQNVLHIDVPWIPGGDPSQESPE